MGYSKALPIEEIRRRRFESWRKWKAKKLLNEPDYFNRIKRSWRAPRKHPRLKKTKAQLMENGKVCRKRWWANLPEDRKQIYREKRNALNRKRRAILGVEHFRIKARARNAKRRAMKRSATINPKAIAEWMERAIRNKYATCYYCGRRVKGALVHFDHVIALSKGGLHEVSNLCVACASCNLKKSSKGLKEWQSLPQKFLAL